MEIAENSNFTVFYDLDLDEKAKMSIVVFEIKSTIAKVTEKSFNFQLF